MSDSKTFMSSSKFPEPARSIESISGSQCVGTARRIFARASSRTSSNGRHPSVFRRCSRTNSVRSLVLGNPRACEVPAPSITISLGIILPLRGRGEYSPLHLSKSCTIGAWAR